MIAGVVPRRANKSINDRLTLLAIAHRGVQPAPQAFSQRFGHHQPLAFKAFHHPVRQRRDTHARRHHLDQQQRVIDAFQRRADASRLQKMAPDIQTLTLHRINQQRFSGKVFRGNARFTGQRVIRRQHQAHFKIKHGRIVQTAARQDI